MAKRDTWYGFVSIKSLGNVRPGTYEEVMKGWNHDLDFPHLLQLENSLGGLKSDPVLAKHFPAVESLLENKPLSQQDLNALGSYLRETKVAHAFWLDERKRLANHGLQGI